MAASDHKPGTPVSSNGEPIGSTGEPIEAVTAESAAKAEDLEYGGSRRVLASPVLRSAWFWLSVAFTGFHLVVLNLYPLDPLLFRSMHVAWASAIGFALFTGFRGASNRSIPWYDWILIAAAIGCGVYIYLELEGLQFRAGAMFTPGDFAMGVVGTFLVLELTRRTAGLALPILSTLFILYAIVGPWLPGVLHHKGYDTGLFFSYIYSDQGVFGITTAVSSTYIVLFIAFACFLQASKAGDYFNDLAIAMVGRARGGPAKATVISGVLFGTISGSAVANVVASGMVTIPLMRKVGYDRATAAAVEATSSTGGQLTPPVMGAGAFLMAEILGIPYTDIAVAAIIPTFLFYLANYIHCDLNAVKLGLKGIGKEDMPSGKAMLRNLYLFSPVVVLIVALLMGYSVFRAGSVGIVAAVVASWFSAREHRMGARAILNAFEATAKETVQLVAVCACAGIIVGVIALTGLGGRFSTILLAVAGQSKLLALLIAMFIAMVLGMGMPTTAAYAVAASVVAPGLIRLGIPPLTAHLFIFYYAVISAITPPVALASFAAAGMAGADPWKTSWIAIKLGLATFIVPFMFYYGPELLMKAPWSDIGLAVVSASIGVFFLASSTEGWFAKGPLPMALRVPLFFFSLFLIIPGVVTDSIGLAGGLTIYAIQRWLLSRGGGPLRPAA